MNMEPTIDQVEEAQGRLSSSITHTPLIPLRTSRSEAPCQVFLKLENLQPIRSFKVRGAGNALLSVASDVLNEGVYTASAGNMAQGVAWHCQELG